MIEIQKGSHVLKVSKCTYNDTFKKLGYKIIEKNSKEEVEKTSSDELLEKKDNLEEELIEKEIEKNKSLQEEVAKSDDLNVNIIGEKIEDFDLKKTSFEKALEDKNNKSKGK